MGSTSMHIPAISNRFRCKFYNALFGLLAMSVTLVEKNTLAQDSANQHPLIPAIEMAKNAWQKLDQIKDYDATFVKREFINNQLTNETTHLKVRHQPFSVYMKFINPAAGREVLYVAGQNGNKLLAREATGLQSLAGTIPLDVNSPTVMANTRHPITDAGMKRLMELVIQQWELESKYGEIDVKFFPDAKMGETPCEVIQVTHPQPRRQFPFAKTLVFFDKSTHLPIRVENYGFPIAPNQPPQLLEEYTYQNIRVNIGLTDLDFDRRNPKYGFN